MLRSFFPVFSSRNFMASGLIYECFIHFSLSFVRRQRSNFLFLNVIFQFSPICKGNYPFSITWSWLPYGILVDYIFQSLIIDSPFCSTGMCLFLCYYYCVSIVIGLQYSQKSVSVMLLVCSSLRIALTIHGFLFHTNFRGFFVLFLWRMLLEFW